MTGLQKMLERTREELSSLKSDVRRFRDLINRASFKKKSEAVQEKVRRRLREREIRVSMMERRIESLESRLAGEAFKKAKDPDGEEAEAAPQDQVQNTG